MINVRIGTMCLGGTSLISIIIIRVISTMGLHITITIVCVCFWVCSAKRKGMFEPKLLSLAIVWVALVIETSHALFARSCALWVWFFKQFYCHPIVWYLIRQNVKVRSIIILSVWIHLIFVVMMLLAVKRVICVTIKHLTLGNCYFHHDKWNTVRVI